MVVPIYNILLTNLESKYNQEESSAFLADAAKAAYCKLNKYYDISSELCTIATVLDPRLKLKFYKDGYTAANGDNPSVGENPEEIRKYLKLFIIAVMLWSRLIYSANLQGRKAKFTERNSPILQPRSWILT
jgi:hypothetical protein